MGYDNCVRLIREGLLMEYRRQQGGWLQQQTGRSAEECLAFVERILQERFRDQQVTISLTGKNGDPEVQQLPLSQLLRQSRSLIVTPSGSGYLPSDREPSLISQMIATKKAERKQVKKRQLQAECDGDQLTAKQCWYKQASIKIGLNSLPGQLASSSNIFYDKGGYNSITSMARNIIPRAYLTCERLLGGNFAWLLEEQVISYLQSLLHHLPEELAIRNQLQRWQLKWPTAIEVSAFLKDGWQRNSRAVVSMERVDRILWRLSPEQLAFIYYYGNLRHLCWDNEERLRPYLRQLLTLPERINRQPMPEVEIVDMRNEFHAGNNSIFSAPLHGALSQCLKAGEQALLFMNRRGYSTFVSCRGCGYVMKCPACDVSMTSHKLAESRISNISVWERSRWKSSLARTSRAFPPCEWTLTPRARKTHMRSFSAALRAGKRRCLSARR